MIPCFVSHGRYNCAVTPVKRDRDWSPEAISATKAAVSAFGLRLCHSRPFYGGSAGRRKPGRFLARGCPVDQPVELPPRLVSEWWFLNRNLLEAFMATSLRATAPTLPTTGTPDPIQLHMQAVNSLSRCKAMLTANEPMYLFAQNFLAEAQQAIDALRAIELKLEG